MKPPSDPHNRHRFSAEIISHTVWLYHVFSLSLRDVELLLAERGIVVSYETVRRWCQKFGQSFAYRLRHRRPRPGDKWFMDEVFIRIQGMQHYLWRAVDQDGVVLDILVQERRDAKAAKRFFRRLLMGLQYVPRVIVTDKLRSYGVAQRQILPQIERRQSRYLNNRAENSHRQTRRGERQIYRIESSRNPGTGGVGLGLSVTRSIIWEHGGDITFATRKGGGLSVRLELPAGPGPSSLVPEKIG